MDEQQRHITTEPAAEGEKKNEKGYISTTPNQSRPRAHESHDEDADLETDETEKEIVLIATINICTLAMHKDPSKKEMDGARVADDF